MLKCQKTLFTTQLNHVSNHVSIFIQITLFFSLCELKKRWWTSCRIFLGHAKNMDKGSQQYSYKNWCMWLIGKDAMACIIKLIKCLK